MKKHSLLKAVAIAAAGIGLCIAQASALTTTYSKDDLFIGFYDASNNATQDYIFNIGQAANFRDAAANSTISLGTIGADLTSVFGDGWSTDQDIRWFVFGATYNVAVGSDPAWTLYLSSQELTIGTPNTPFAIGATDGQAIVGNAINDVGNAFKGKTGSGSLNALKQTSTATNSLYSQTDGIQIFEGYVTGGFGNGTSGSVLDLFRLPGDHATSDGSLGSYEGSFSIDSSGTITFTAAPIPEPSVCMLIAVGGAIFLVSLRRFRKSHTA